MAGEPTFAPPVAPAFPLNDAREPRILKSQFGDGYTGRVRDGINHDPMSNTWVWENLTYAEYTAIWDFFVARGGDQAFMYAVPWGEGSPTAKKWVSPKYERARSSANAWMVKAEVQQVFEG